MSPEFWRRAMKVRIEAQGDDRVAEVSHKGPPDNPAWPDKVHDTHYLKKGSTSVVVDLTSGGYVEVRSIDASQVPEEPEPARRSGQTGDEPEPQNESEKVMARNEGRTLKKEKDQRDR